MIYQLRANLFFTEMSDAEDMVKHIAAKMVDAVVIHPDEENQEGCSVELIKCYHDETPTSPCEVIGITTSP